MDSDRSCSKITKGKLRCTSGFDEYDGFEQAKDLSGKELDLHIDGYDCQDMRIMIDCLFDDLEEKGVECCFHELVESHTKLNVWGSRKERRQVLRTRLGSCWPMVVFESAVAKLAVSVCYECCDDAKKEKERLDEKIREEEDMKSLIEGYEKSCDIGAEPEGGAEEDDNCICRRCGYEVKHYGNVCEGCGYDE